MADAVTFAQSAHDSARAPTVTPGKRRVGLTTGCPADTGFAPAHVAHACMGEA